MTPPARSAHVVFVLGAAAALALALRGRGTHEDRAEALVDALRGRGLVASPSELRWLDTPRGTSMFFADARAVVRAAQGPNEPHDLYLVEARLSPEGVLLDVGAVHNLTETSGADEGVPITRGGRIAYAARPLVTEAAVTIHVLDLAGQEPPVAEWSSIERAQNALTNYQQTGQLAGIAKRTLAVDRSPEASPSDVSVELGDRSLTIVAAGAEAEVPLDDARHTLPPWLRSETTELARPGNLVTWAVDRVRAVIGDDAMQTIKAVAFTALDFVQRNRERVTGDTGAADIADDLGKTELAPLERSIPVDPEIGWPPAPLDAWVTPALPGEGVWSPVDEIYIRYRPGLPPAFVSTFMRSDRERKATRVYVTLWDPRQVELHMMAGTVEPKGATGEAGPGLIPRSPEIMRRVVAASNAGFQALHGEFGMMADGVVYLPPKPFAATVAVQRDGRTVFGTWPEDTSIPESILSYRQNMTVMVQDEKYNPYKRTWWGGTPPGWEDKTHTVRTGICLTREHFIAYFYGSEISPEALAQAMIQTRCKFGIALDMNAGHSGLEFYKVAPSIDLKPLDRPLDYSWEREGEVSGLDGFRFRARKFIKGMGLMNFPRYIRREARDFFYMTLRSTLPLEPFAPVLQPPLSGEGEWRVKGLPQHGFPYALALTELRPSAARPGVKVRVLSMDPRTVKAADKGGERTIAVLDPGPVAAPPRGDAVSVWHSAGAFSIAPVPPVENAVRLATGTTASTDAATAALGVHDEDGMLFYAEIATAATSDPAAPANDGKLLTELLKRAGCGTRVMLARPLPIALAGDTDLGGAATRAPSSATAVRLVRAEAPSAGRFFEDTPVVPFDVWFRLQQQRIRYFKKHEPAEGDTH